MVYAGFLASITRNVAIGTAGIVLPLRDPLIVAKQTASVDQQLGGRFILGLASGVPIETAREARDAARQLGADCAIAIGGGSTTGLGKAIALDSGLPILAFLTAYAGSEMTPVSVQVSSVHQAAVAKRSIPPLLGNLY